MFKIKEKLQISQNKTSDLLKVKLFTLQAILYINSKSHGKPNDVNVTCSYYRSLNHSFFHHQKSRLYIYVIDFFI